MSTILPLEVVFGRSIWSLQTATPSFVRGFDPSPLFGIKLFERTALGVSPRFPYADQQRFPDPFNPSPFERIPHSEGLLGDGWDDHNAFLKSSAYIVYNSYQNRFREGLFVMEPWSDGGGFGSDKWGAEIVPGYAFVKPFVVDDDGVSSDGPFGIDDITAPHEEVFLTGECGDGGGSERPESGLLYPRKV